MNGVDEELVAMEGEDGGFLYTGYVDLKGMVCGIASISRNFLAPFDSQLEYSVQYNAVVNCRYQKRKVEREKEKRRSSKKRKK